MHRLRNWLIACALTLATATPVLAQEPAWTTPLEGIGSIFGAATGVGVLLVTPVDDEPTGVVEALLREKLLASGVVEVVLDDSPLGDLTGKSDDEIIEMARKYPVDMVIVLRTFPGADGPTAVLRIEGDTKRSIRFGPQASPPWAPATPPPAEDPVAAAQDRVKRSGRERAAMTRMMAVGVAETQRLIEAEQGRRRFTLQGEPKDPVVLDPAGAVVPWPEPYVLLQRDDLASKFRKRRTLKRATIATGVVLAAAGFGTLFVGLANQANCGSGSAGCGRPALIFGGLGSLALGTIGVLTGVMLKKHPVPPDEIQRLVEQHNASLD